MSSDTLIKIYLFSSGAIAVALLWAVIHLKPKKTVYPVKYGCVNCGKEFTSNPVEGPDRDARVRAMNEVFRAHDQASPDCNHFDLKVI